MPPTSETTANTMLRIGTATGEEEIRRAVDDFNGGRFGAVAG